MEDPLAEALLEEKRELGSTIKIKMNKSRDGLDFDWVKPAPGKERKEELKPSEKDATEKLNTSEEEPKEA